jgi:hypothetical protein
MSFAKPTLARIEDDHYAESKLMCIAHNCPNRWSVSISNLCSAHAWSDPHDWPKITDAEITRVAMRSSPKQPERVEPVTEAQKRAAINSLRTLAHTHENPKKWALKLKQRETEGESLSIIQRRFWREALNELS